MKSSEDEASFEEYGDAVKDSKSFRLGKLNSSWNNKDNGGLKIRFTEVAGFDKK